MGIMSIDEGAGVWDGYGYGDGGSSQRLEAVLVSGVRDWWLQSS